MSAACFGLQRSLVVQFLGIILVPLGNLDDDVGRAVGNGLAAETRFGRNAGCLVEFIQFRIGGFIAGLEAFPDDEVARRAGANPAAGMIEAHFEALGNVKNAARKAVVAVRDFFRVDFDRFAAGKKRHFVFLRGGLVFDFFDVWVG